MGVKGLWKLVEEAGTPVPLESLENKILAVDVSIWLHQAVRGFRGIGGDAVANSHLLTLFHRICKLLFYRIKPVFVFDGGVPNLKKQTQSFRRVRRETAANKADRVRQRLLSNLLKSHAVRSALGRSGPAPTEHRVAPAPKPKQKDMFELPPLPEGETLGGESLKRELSESSDEEAEETSKSKKRKRKFNHKNIHNYDFESEEFRSLPLQKQHEILVDLQESRKDNSWMNINSMPSESSGFASYQMNRLLKRSKFQETIDNTRAAIQKEKSDELEMELFGDLEKHVSQSHKIASEDAAHSIFITRESEASTELPPEESDKPKKKVDKGKSLMKKPKLDFLQELRKEGILGNPHLAVGSDSEIESSDEDVPVNVPKQEDDDALVHVMNYVMSDNNGLTQDEIMHLIKQTKQEVEILDCKQNYDVPSTSREASGFIGNTDVMDTSDSDADDFIEVLDESVSSSTSPTDATNPSVTVNPNIVEDQRKINSTDSLNVLIGSNNIDAIRASNSSSLYIKIVQHRLDDIIGDDEVTSPKKAKVDSRNPSLLSPPRFVASPSKTKLKPNKKSSENGGISLSIDLSKKELSEDEDIFADIFSKAVPKPVSNLDNDSFCAAQADPPDLNKYGTAHKISKPTDRKQTSTKHNESKGNILVSSPVVIDDHVKNKVDELVKLQIEKFLLTSEFSPVITKEIAGALKSTSVLTPTEVSDCSNSGSKTQSDITLAVPRESNANKPDEISVHDSSCADSSASIDSPLAVNDIDSEESDGDFIEVEEATVPTEPHPTVIDEAKIPVTSSKKGVTFQDSCVEKILPDENALMPSKSNSSNDNTNTDGVIEKASEIESVTANAHNYVSPVTNNSSSDSHVNDASEDIVVDLSHAPNHDDLKKIEKDLAKEQQILVAQAQKGDRIASNLSQQMYTDAQELLQLFGLPYLVAPMEAEAQCAFLEDVGLTNGTITDDSDAFLFGSKRIYKNFFNQSQHVELYKLDNIKTNYGLDRDKLICLALLTGSDYTVGIEGIGGVSGMEILSEFPGQGMDILRNFKKWWTSFNRGVTAIKLSKVREKMGKVYLPEGFPSDEVHKAYTQPDVDESREKFGWSLPNTGALRGFTAEKLGWSRNKTDEILIPVMKRLNIKSSQTRIDTYINNIKLVKTTKMPSKRLKEAIARSKGETFVDSPPKENRMNVIRKQHESQTKAVKTNKRGKKKEDNDSDYVQSGGSSSSSVTGRQAAGRNNTSDASGPEMSKRGRPRRQQTAATAADVLPVDDVEPKKPLSKEERKLRNYQNLLKNKDEISQRTAGDAEMQRKKHEAALLLKKKLGKK